MRALSCRAVQRSQQGFGLLEFAMVLALLGVLGSMVFKASELMETYQQSRFVHSVRTLASAAQSFHSLQGRWPGDCNRDGLVDYRFVSSASLEGGSLLDYGIPAALAQASSASASYSLGLVCPPASLAPFANANVPLNELKWAGQLAVGEPNRKLANHGMGGFAYLGTFQTVAGTGQIDDRFNALVLTHVPVNAARALAAAVDGSDGSAGNLNRVRRTDDMITFATLWTASGETQDRLVSVVYFFDRMPPAGN